MTTVPSTNSTWSGPISSPKPPWTIRPHVLPRSGETVNVPAKLVPYFKVSREMKNLVEKADPITDEDIDNLFSE